MKSLKDLLDDKKGIDKNKYVSKEFQDYGVRLAMEFGDEPLTSLYIKLAKTTERKLLEDARSFVIDSTAHNKGALFMWKLKQLRQKEPKK